jgi:hypothetical protein
MQEKEEKVIKDENDAQGFDLLNTLDPKNEEEDADGLQEVPPEVSLSKDNDDFLLELINIEDANEKENNKDGSNSPPPSVPFQESKKEAVTNLFSLEELLADPVEQEEIKQEVESEEENIFTGEHKNKFRPKVSAKVCKPDSDGDENGDPDPLGDDSSQNQTDFFDNGIKESVAESVRLDNTVTSNLFVSKATYSGIIEDVAEEDNNIHEGVSDDEDEEAKVEWDKFMQESEEFGEAQNKKKAAERELTQSEVTQQMVPRNSFDYF